MTAITTTWDYTCSFCDAVGSYFKKSLKNLMLARQMSANRKVARDLVGLGFYQQKEYDQILREMNTRTADEYHGK